MKKLVIVLFTFMLLAAVPQAMVNLSTEFGNGADAGIQNDGQTNPPGGPSVNNGAATSVQIRHYDGVRAKAMILRFDISNLVGDLSGSTLSISVGSTSNRTRTMNIYGLIDGEGELWDESAVCYNNAPGMITDPMPALGYLSIDTAMWSLLGTMSFASTANIINTGAVDVSSLVSADTNGVISLLLYTATSDSSQGWWCITKEGGTEALPAPTLIFPNAVPEPATMVLLGLGSLLVFRRKRG